MVLWEGMGQRQIMEVAKSAREGETEQEMDPGMGPGTEEAIATGPSSAETAK